jgi:hypothetical protein
MKTFVIAGQSYQAENCIDDILVNPLLPENFNSTPMDARSQDHMDKWYQLPYILSNSGFYTVRCLDGGAWDRSSLKGGFDSLNQAIDFIIGTYRK